MADIVSKKKRSEIMSSVRSKNSQIEIKFRKAIWGKGFRYRKNPISYFGKPDIVLKKYKSVIFIDSCFWHGCKRHCRIPTTRRKYWVQKIKSNIERDRKVSSYYKKIDWQVIRVWEHSMLKGFDKTVRKIENFLIHEI